MNLLEKLVDFFQVTVRGQHKHEYERISGGFVNAPKRYHGTVSWDQYRCSDCGKTIALYDGKNLAYSKKYEKVKQTE
ncbi:hypothetical protein HZA97_02595 [Candidatus Woesearchaeota archaeon]|nr:hypothetical protein [Candidatus Woesearchaeota archaeon]